MSGSFEQLDVPPTLVSFAVTTGTVDQVISPEFKQAGHRVVLLQPQYDENGLPVTESLLQTFQTVTDLVRSKKAAAVYTPTYGGVAEAIFKMTMGTRIGFTFDASVDLSVLFAYHYGAFVVELTSDDEVGVLLGTTVSPLQLKWGEKAVDLEELYALYENKLEDVFPCNQVGKTSTDADQETVENFSYPAQTRRGPKIRQTKPRVLIPVFPGTNCEYDTAKALAAAGAQPEIFVINNLTADAVSQSVRLFAEKIEQSQIIFIPGGFSGGDEPDGSGKFITAFFRNPEISQAVTDLLEVRDGLMGGICNGFQALIKLGLVPYGKIVQTDEHCPTLTYNTIGRHQSKLVRTRVASNQSPWMMHTEVGQVFTVPISHGEGRFIAEPELIRQLAQNGQILTQYVDLQGQATMDIAFNPNGSFCAIEGITSPDGRVFGKMGHSERVGTGLYQNVDGCYDMGLFRSAVEYFSL